MLSGCIIGLIQSQICKRWNKHWHNRFNKNADWHRHFWPKAYPNAMKHCNWVKDKVNKLLSAKVICNNHSSWSASIIVVPNGDSCKCLVIDYRGLNKVRKKFFWSMPKVEDIFFKLNGAKYFLWTFELGTTSYLSMTPQSLRQPSHQFWQVWVIESTVWNSASTHLPPGADEQVFEGPTIHYSLPRWYNYLQLNCRRTSKKPRTDVS